MGKEKEVSVNLVQSSGERKLTVRGNQRKRDHTAGKEGKERLSLGKG